MSALVLGRKGKPLPSLPGPPPSLPRDSRPLEELAVPLTMDLLIIFLKPSSFPGSNIGHRSVACCVQPG